MKIGSLDATLVEALLKPRIESGWPLTMGTGLCRHSLHRNDFDTRRLGERGFNAGESAGSTATYLREAVGVDVRTNIRLPRGG